MEQFAGLEKAGNKTWLRKAHTWILAGYAAASLILAAVYVCLDMPYFYWMSLGTLFILPVLQGVYRLLGMRSVYSLDIAVVCYTFLSYTVGVALGAYKIVPLYDKLMHFMSGTLSMMLAYPVFYLLKANHTVEKSDFPLAAAFCLCASVAVGGLWEIGEYIINLLTGIDTQAVHLTGIHDTMQDMIVCALGALIFLPFMRDVYAGKPARLFMVPADDFIRQCGVVRGMRSADAPSRGAAAEGAPVSRADEIRIRRKI